MQAPLHLLLGGAIGVGGYTFRALQVYGSQDLTLYSSVERLTTRTSHQGSRVNSTGTVGRRSLTIPLFKRHMSCSHTAHPNQGKAHSLGSRELLATKGGLDESKDGEEENACLGVRGNTTS